MAPKKIWIENLILILNKKSTLYTRKDIHKHTNNRRESKCNKLTTLAIISVYNNLYNSTILATAAQPILTKILTQPISFMMHAGSIGTNDECTDYTNRKGTMNLVTGVQSQHLWYTLMNADSTPGKTKTTIERNGDCKWKGGPRRMKGTEGQGITMKMYKSKEENQKKIILYILINIYSCFTTIYTLYNIFCNVLVDSRFRTQASEKEIKCRPVADGKGSSKDMCSLKNFYKLQTIRTPLGVETRNKSTLCGKKVLPINLGKYESIYRVDKSFSTHLMWEEVSISKLTIFNCCFKLDHSQNKLLSNLDILHTVNYIKMKLMNDI